MNNRKGHLEDGDLLRLLDGELDDAAASEVQLHIESCWNCRAQFQEMESVIGDYVRYRKTADSLLPPPPQPWRDLRFQSARLSAELEPPALYLPARHRWFNWRWALAPIAALLAIAASYWPRGAPEMTTEVLLRRGTHVESVRGSIRVRTRGRALVRPAVLQSGMQDDEVNVRSMFERARYDWRQPFTAKAFAAWHDQLPEKRDEVTVGKEEYVISTATHSSELRRATLTLRKRDLRPQREMLEFIGETVEIEPADAPSAAPNPPQQIAAAPSSAKTETTPENTLHLLLQVFSALHGLQADLGEPVEITQHLGHIEIAATGFSAARQQQLRAAIHDIPSVSLHFDSGAPRGKAAREPANIAQPSGAAGPSRLEAILGSAQAVQDFTDRALDASDAVMARAYALRALARAFGPAQEAELNAVDRRLLAQLRREHAGALAARVADLRAALSPLLGELQNSSNSANAQNLWQDASQNLFAAAQEFDQALNRELASGGTPDSGFSKLSAAFAQVDRASTAMAGR